MRHLVSTRDRDSHRLHAGMLENVASGDVQPGMDEIDLLPPRGTQPMPERQQDHGRIPMPVPIVAAAFISRSTSLSVRYSRTR
jgi:hypothetical protein